MAAAMNIRKFAVLMVLVLSSLAASGVSPSKTELEAMYDKAFREFDANNYEQALKDLDAIDARQPDLAESHNLRGVIFMRQKQYEEAEAALRRALQADPKFWNARFNLAEVPFLQKNWAEARKRFQELLSGSNAELQGEAKQLIQYKILLTHLMEGKEPMVQSLIAKFELTPEMPAVHYANAAVALNKKDETQAKEWLTRAEKAFSPQLNKLFAESLYTIGWLEKPAGQTRAALELNTAAERAAQAKAFARAKFEEAEQALQQRDFTAARKLIDEADAADPNQPGIINLRGEVFMEQRQFEQAEAEFRRALKLDPKFRDAQYNLAQVPFKRGEYATARERFEQLFASTTGNDKDRAAQLIKYKVYLTYLLEGKDAVARKQMEQFQFTGDTPALYYAQAAWEFKNNNAQKANDWVTSARKIYSPALNSVFSDAFYDLGWLQSAAAEPSAALADAGAQPETAATTIEPTPIPAVTLAQNNRARGADPLTQAAQLPAQPEVPGMEATTSGAEATPSASTMIASASPSVETPVAATATPAEMTPSIIEPQPTVAPAVAAAASPATALAPARVREWSQPTVTERFEQLDGFSQTFVVVLGVAVILLLSYVMISLFRRRTAEKPAHYAAPVASAQDYSDDAAPVGTLAQLVGPVRLAGAPPQVSLQLRASEPALRRPVMPGGKGSRFGNGHAHENGNGNGHGNGYANRHGNGHAKTFGGAAAAAAPALTEPAPQAAAAVEETFDEGVGEPMPVFAEAPETTVAPAFEEAETPAVVEIPEPVYAQQPVSMPAPVFTHEPVFAAAPAVTAEPAFAAAPMVARMGEAAAAGEFSTAGFESRGEDFSPLPVETAQTGGNDFTPPPVDTFSAPEPVFTEPEPEQISEPIVEPAAEQIAEPMEAAAAPVVAATEDFEPIGQGAPVPYLESATEDAAPEVAPAAPEMAPPAAAPVLASTAAAGLAGIGALRHSVTRPSPVVEVVSEPEPTAQQQTQPETMAQPTQPTPAPVIRTGPQGGPAQQPAAGGAQQPQAQGAAPQQQVGGQAQGGMQTAVQITFPFEIASLQLTPTFKMGALQLRPTSRVVTMRLAPSQHPQPAMNLQVTFEIASVQLAGNSIGMLRLTPSQQQRPGITSSPSFNIAGLSLMQGADAAPVQLTPAQQGQASVLVTTGFQISTVEFSPSFDIASIILNATGRNAQVQLPGTGPSSVEGAPTFEISNVQLGGAGEISMMQLNAPGFGAQKR
jgi:tetratricopeptide (TPR) repeat protein